MRKRFIFIISIALVSLIALGAGILINQVTAKERKSLETVLEDVGQFIRSNSELFLDGLNLTKQIPSEEVVAWVNGLPISYNELKFRLGLNTSSGLGPQTLNGVFKLLVREKVIQEEAIKFGLVPTNEEIENYLARKKENAKQSSEYRLIIEKIINSWGITEDKYWNLYERYNITRLMTLDKLSRHVLKDYYSKKERTLEDEKQAKREWDKYIEELLSKAEIKINPQFDSLKLSVE